MKAAKAMYEAKMASLETAITDKESTITTLTNEINILKSSSLTPQQIDDFQQRIASLEAEKTNADGKIKKLEEFLAGKDIQCEEIIGAKEPVCDFLVIVWSIAGVSLALIVIGGSYYWLCNRKPVNPG